MVPCFLLCNEALGLYLQRDAGNGGFSRRKHSSTLVTVGTSLICRIFAVARRLQGVAYPSEDSGQANFYEKALFVKADLVASSLPSAAAGPFALCFYSHSRGAHILLVARCIG